jgi:uncharacterized metal-binding protein
MFVQTVKNNSQTLKLYMDNISRSRDRDRDLFEKRLQESKNENAKLRRRIKQMESADYTSMTSLTVFN